MTGIDEIVQQLREVDTPTVSNAIEKLRVRSVTSGFCNRDLRCLTPELGVLCGYAVTAHVETMNPNGRPGALDAKFVELCEALSAVRRPSIVVFQECSGRPEFSAHCGEVMASTFRRLGCIGLVSDSAVRDFVEVRNIGFHYFATGLVASHGSFRVVRSQAPVTVAGLQIDTGDLLHGDVNGLLKVPEDGRERIPEMIEQVHDAERAIMDYVAGDEFSLDGLRDRLVH